MSKLSTQSRKSIPKGEFGLPEQKKYPMPDRRHAANAKARASQEEHRGLLSSADKKRVDNKADKILDKKSG